MMGDAFLRCIQGALPPGSLPSLGVSDAAEQEGFGAEFAVTLSAPGYREVSVDFATADGTATASTKDYLPAAGRLTFAPGETTKTITVGLSSDGVAEPDETFAVNLGNASNATIADARGVGAIRDFAPRVVTRIEIEPALQVAVGGSGQFNARAFDQYGNRMFPHVRWQSSDGNVGHVNSYNNSASYVGVATGVNVGTTHVTATSDGVTSNTATLTVYTPVLSRIELSASGSTHAVGGAVQLYARAFDQYGRTFWGGATYAWAASAPSVVQVQESTVLMAGHSTSVNNAAAVGAGAATVTASSNGVTSNAVTLTVGPGVAP